MSELGRREIDSGEQANGYTSMVGVSDKPDTILRGPGSLLTPECRGHCVDAPGVSR